MILLNLICTDEGLRLLKIIENLKEQKLDIDRQQKFESYLKNLEVCDFMEINPTTLAIF